MTSSPPDRPQRLEGVEEVAGFLGVSEDWVYDRAAAGELPSYRVGRFVKFDMVEVWAVVQTWRATGEAA